MNPGETVPAAKSLVLVGGGHSHALALRMLGMKPMEGVEVTVVSDVAHAPYSGMLPGYIAGFYSYDEAHIDLRKLCQFAAARFVQATCLGLDVENKRVILEGRSSISYDAVSLNTGSTPGTSDVPGVSEFAVASKPVPELLEDWEGFVALQEEGQLCRVAIVGGGAGGVELAVSMKQRLGAAARVTVIHAGAEILESHNPRVRKIFKGLLNERSIAMHADERVSEVTAGKLRCASGLEVEADRIYWVTNASPAPWVETSGLKTDENGFLLVSSTLQSLSNPDVFAAGDVATMEGEPRPKSGVFAVRMAKPLLANFRGYFNSTPLRPYRPQKEFLSLIGTATGEAVASRKLLAWRSPLMWKLKDWIDRKFMAKFEDLPDMGLEEDGPVATSSETLPDQVAELKRRSQMRCLGCAAKVGGSILTSALDRLREGRHGSPALALLDHAEDAAVFPVPSGHELVQTVDYLPALVADPWLFGRIATLHCFSDIFAMGAKPHSALANALIPFAAEKIAEESLYQLLCGIVDALGEMGAALYGGHTAEGNVLALGLTCNGLAKPGTTMQKATPTPGHSILLTKPIGTGTLFAAEMRLKTKGRWIDAAIESMSLSNQGASEILHRYGASACTDVTGFGLAGHLVEMLKPTRVTARLNLESIPFLEGAITTAENGILSSLHGQNSRAMHALETPSRITEHLAYPLLFDPQTSGGLLAMVPADHVSDCLAALVDDGCSAAVQIGTVEEQLSGSSTDALVRFATE